MNALCVVGGGPAGMMAALMAARSGVQVTLLEKNEKLGKKLYITGKGRCNLTNAVDGEAFLHHVPRNPKFLHGALGGLSTQQLMDFFESLGVPLKVERGGRVFPVSDKASDITRALEKALRAQHVDVRLNAQVVSIDTWEGKLTGVRLKQGAPIACDALILACGGLSYPMTGCTGDGYRFAKEAGHTISRLFPALCSVNVQEAFAKRLSGLALKNVSLRAQMLKKMIFEEQGELLFTHTGISGPLTLSLSSHLVGQELSEIQLFIDTKPALSLDVLEKRLQRDFDEQAKKSCLSSLDALLPRAMAHELVAMIGPAHLPIRGVMGQISKATRKKMALLLKNLPLTPTGLGGFDEAIITRGGVSVKEIVPATMASKKVKGLYFAGEMVDVDAYTGGFNLHIAFATGALAGSAAARTIMEGTI